MARASGGSGGRDEESWVEDLRAFPSGTPLNTDDRPYVELVAPRLNVRRASEVASQAAAQYAAMATAGGDVRLVLSGVPESGLAAAELLHELAARYAAARQQRWREARDAIARAKALDPKAPVDPALLGFLDRQAP